MIQEPIRDLGELAKEIDKDYSHQDLIGDIYLYLSGTIKGFPIDHSFKLRAGEVTRKTLIDFLGSFNSAGDVNIYQNLVARIETGTSQLPPELFGEAKEYLYDKRKFPKLSKAKRKDGFVREMEKSFVLDSKMQFYWDQIGWFGYYLLNGTINSGYSCLDRGGKVISGESLSGSSNEKECILSARGFLPTSFRISGTVAMESYNCTLPWRANHLINDLMRLTEDSANDLFLTIKEMSLLLHFKGKSERITWLEPESTDLFFRQMDLNLYSWIQTYGLAERIFD